MEKSSFAGIIEAEKEDLGLLLPETKGGQDAVEPVNEEHRWRRLKADRREIERDLGRLKTGGAGSTERNWEFGWRR